MKEKSAASILKRPRWAKISAYIVATLIVVYSLLGIYWSRSPDIFWVNHSIDDNRVVVGYATTDTLIRVADTMLEKPGGYLNNDRFPPGVFLDNTPNWEVGVLQQVRDLATVIREDFSRSQSQSREDDDVKDAEQAFYIDSNSWILPTSESAYRDAIDGFILYRDRLGDDADTNAQFYARADNLRHWLEKVEKRLGSMTRRLGDSVATSRINENLAGDAAAESTGPQPDNIEIRTSWFEVDDVFFEARGTAWALVHFFRAAELDFAGVLEDKNAQASVRQIIRELEASLQPLGSPMILNGSGYGFFANHSLVMANYLARANAAVINLRELLDQG
ncbi:MAG: DUF2333 family protein [Woeseiaceae bacterium]